MSETRPVQGQIHAPNPVELFWEKHKRWIVAVAAVALVALGLNYGLTYFQQKRVDAEWSSFLTATGLDKGYAADGSLAFLLGNEQLQQGPLGQSFQSAWTYLGVTRAELATELKEDLAAGEDLSGAIQKAKGTDLEPLLLWAAAVRHAEKQEWSAALEALDRLEQGFPDHFLNHTSEYPPQYRPAVEEEKGEEADPAAEKSGRDRQRDPPKLESPVAGSPVSLLRAQITKEVEFRESQAALYAPPEPDPTPEVVIRFAPLDEEVRIRFYRDLAPKHVDSFLERVRAGFYDKQRIDEVHREGETSFGGPTPRQLHFGLEASRLDDRDAWDAARSKPSSVVLEFEDNDLSHFPGMVAAEPAADGKSSGERIWINANDAVSFDGQRVIFGRVVEGLDVIDQITGLAFVDDEMERSGRGKLQTNVTIESITIVGDVPEPPAKEGEGPKEGGGQEGEGPKSGEEVPPKNEGSTEEQGPPKEPKKPGEGGR